MENFFATHIRSLFDPIVDLWLRAMDRLAPRNLLRKHHLSFITIHYLCIMGLTIIGSILLFPGGGLRYIDSLYFASGGATQSGLNPVNVNQLNTYQQVVLHSVPFLATPIFINTVVVFVRLHWFEKRFQHIAQAARDYRRTKSRSRTEAKGDHTPDAEEKGVNGRSIVVMLNGQKTKPEKRHAAQGDPRPKDEIITSNGPASSEGDSASSLSHEKNGNAVLPANPTSPFTRDIVFADEVRKPASPQEEMRVPEQRSADEHIAFLEKQRNPKDKGALRIPGPRDYDRGDKPQSVVDEDIEESSSPIQTRSQRLGSASGVAAELNEDDHHVKKNATTDDSQRSRGIRAGLSAFGLRSYGGDGEPSMLSKTFSGLRNRTRTNTFASTKTQNSANAIPYLSWQPTIGRNSAFVDLNEEQREELGGIEYRALKTLAWILCFYYLGFHVLGVICFVPYILHHNKYGQIVDSDGINRTWWGIFSSATCFNDVGFTLTPDSFISFNDSKFVLLLGSFLIVIGNTGFPCMLRFIIWAISKFVPVGSSLWEELKFLLDHPRRCFTLLFPARATWVLFWILVVLNGIDLLFYIILDFNNPVVSGIPVHTRILDGWFQAVSTRTAGTSCVNLADLHPGIQVSYLIMMYISVYPIAISVRRTNVYEEKSLGVYSSKSESAEDESEPSYIGAHLRKQLSFDLWYIFLGLFVITCIEGKHVENTNEYAFTIYSILFEIVSAYGTVGLSLGYPNFDTSFSAQFSVTSKLIMVAMQIRGRHRGLPYELDRAIMLPSESLHRKEDEDARERMNRRGSAMSGMTRRQSQIGSIKDGNKPTSMGTRLPMSKSDGEKKD